MEKIRVLLYTDRFYKDNPAGNFTLDFDDPTTAPLGLNVMRDLIEKDRFRFMEVKFDLINRNDPNHSAQKLRPELLANYDELWVFGYYMASTTVAPEFEGEYGGTRNELDDGEVETLRSWMGEGGLLITGDHAEADPRPVDGVFPDPPLLMMSRGRALGYRIPRAGEMREWEGKPEAIAGGRDFFTNNSQTPGAILNLRDPLLQSDSLPQQISLYTYESRNGVRPHALFNTGRDIMIEVFPDHMHEGSLAIPNAVGGDWPAKSPKPFFVAWGANKSSNPPKFFPIVSVYDGDLADPQVGRIVADSSWHHYTNLNLRGFSEEVLDSLGGYYRNLVCWLLPRSKRKAIATAVFSWLAEHPRVKEAIGSGLPILAERVKDLVESHIHPIEAEQLSQEIERVAQKTLENKKEITSLLRDEFIFGSMLEVYHQQGQSRGRKENIFSEESIIEAVERTVKSLSSVEARAEVAFTGIVGFPFKVEEKEYSNMSSEDKRTYEAEGNLFAETRVNPFCDRWGSTLDPGRPNQRNDGVLLIRDTAPPSLNDVLVHKPEQNPQSQPGRTSSGQIIFRVPIGGGQFRNYSGRMISSSTIRGRYGVSLSPFELDQLEELFSQQDDDKNEVKPFQDGGGWEATRPPQ
jgi:hypothetical protein